MLIFLVFYFQICSNSLKLLGVVITPFYEVVPQVLILTLGSHFGDHDSLGPLATGVFQEGFQWAIRLRALVCTPVWAQVILNFLFLNLNVGTLFPKLLI